MQILRQSHVITPEMQIKYFNESVFPEYEKKNPDKFLVSILNDDELIDQVNQFTLGYGLKAKSNVGSVADDHVKNCGKEDGIIFIDK